AYLLWLYQRVFFGPVSNPKNEKLLDLSARELATFIPLVAIAFWIGLYPKPLFQILSTPINNLVATVRPDYPGLNKPVLATQPLSPTPSESPAVVPQPTNAPETQKAPAATQSQVERPFRVGSGPANLNQSRLQPAAPAASGKSAGKLEKSGTASLHTTNRRSLDSGNQNQVASARDDNSTRVAGALNNFAPANAK
ncbi:MAG: hypothetical protein ABSD98_16065, partial [Candidatus Korobacteraceae bacterium]